MNRLPKLILCIILPATGVLFPDLPDTAAP